MTIGEVTTAHAARRLKLSLSSVRFHRALASPGGETPRSGAVPYVGQKKILKKLWQEFFSDPSQWWDHRSDKRNARYPDFKHKKTPKSLWLNSKYNPPWVEAELAAMAPETVQSSIFSWNARLARYLKAGQYEKTIELFQQMQQEGLNADRFTFVSVVNACASLQALEEGQHIHTQILQSGFESNVYVGGSLVHMYAKCGSIEDAWRVFCKMPTRNIVAWNVMILGCAKCGQGQKALELYRQMLQGAMDPDPVTFVGLLNACASEMALEEGRQLHEQIIQMGFESDLFVGNSLVDMYTKCESIEDALRVFNQMPTRDVVTWTALMLGYVKCGQGQKALGLYQQMQQEGVDPDSHVFVAVLNACASVGALEEGRRVHDQIIHNSCELDVFVGNSLIDMYAKCGSIEEAERVFIKMTTRDVVSWSAMLGGYALHGHAKEALVHFKRMRQLGVEMDEITLVSLLSACGQQGRWMKA